MRVYPGHSVVTRTPSGRSSSCSAWPNEVTNAFVAAYVALSGIGWNDARDETLRMAPPPRAAMARAAACDSRTTASTLSRTWRSSSSTGCVWNGP
ncbi:MAG: hypothetical protein KatS3mg009_2100 [Acidimicrobiia bacterium]|nr:MAG: hypothetical protein KatS3mg009_2100 [Acidimicrobiia bacterium]